MFGILENHLNLLLFALARCDFRDYLLTYLLSDRLIDQIRQPNRPNRNRASPGDDFLEKIILFEGAACKKRPAVVLEQPVAYFPRTQQKLFLATGC